MKPRTNWARAVGIILSAAIAAGAAEKPPTKPLKWKDCLKQKAEWHAGDEAVRIADNVLLYQLDCGGWMKNIEMAKALSDKEKAAVSDRKAKNENDATIDNGATYTQVAYLARVYGATKNERFKNAFLKGVDYLLKAQYGNGGWPQFYPRNKGYYIHITFNDNAMTGVLRVLNDIARKASPYGFVDEDRRVKAEKAVNKGIDCILKCQIVVNAKRTVWCAQHDEVTLKPAPARAYEKVSLSGHESVGIVRFLMGIDRPTSQVIEAVQSAVAWFNGAGLTGIRLIDTQDPSDPAKPDKAVVKDLTAPPLWARFYEIGTNRPIFCGRDGVIKYSLSEIERERRTGYSWYSDSPARLLSKDYPAWQAKWAPDKNVLEKN